MEKICTHLNQIKKVKPKTPEGCEVVLETGYILCTCAFA